jgi:hypothetical protein
VSRYLNGIVPCSEDRCIEFATVFARLRTGVFEAAFFCDNHLPTGWQIQDGAVGSTGLQIILNKPN